MKQKLLESLKTKFNGVQDSILDGVATKLAKTVTKEDQIETAISGVTFDTLLQSETDRRTTEASETARKNAIKDYEKTHKLKDGKSTEKPKEPDPDPSKGKGGDGEETPAWAKALAEKLEAQEQRLEKQEKDKELSTKRSQAKDLLKGTKLPEKLQEKWLKRVDVEDEDTSLEDQVKALETEYLDLKQEHINESTDGGDGVKGGEVPDAVMGEFLDTEFPKEAAE